MQIIWRTLPRLALPAAIGLGLAYLATGFVPRPAPNLRPPEELRARGQGYAEESPVRTILERNVLNLESPLFYPLGQPPAPIPAPQPRKAASADVRVAPPAQAAFAPADTRVAPPAASLPGASQPGMSAGLPLSATAPLSGGSRVQGLAAPPAAASPAQSAPESAPVSAAPVSSAPAAAKTPAAAMPVPQPRPAVPTAAAPVAQPVAPTAPGLGIEGFRLVGVIAGGEQPLAMLQVDGAAVSLRPGDQVRGWTLVSVEPGQVLLRQGTALRRVVLAAPRP